MSENFEGFIETSVPINHSEQRSGVEGYKGAPMYKHFAEHRPGLLVHLEDLINRCANLGSPEYIFEDIPKSTKSEWVRLAEILADYDTESKKPENARIDLKKPFSRKIEALRESWD